MAVTHKALSPCDALKKCGATHIKLKEWRMEMLLCDALLHRCVAGKVLFLGIRISLLKQTLGITYP
jgi:hypothetical protein